MSIPGFEKKTKQQCADDMMIMAGLKKPKTPPKRKKRKKENTNRDMAEKRLEHKILLNLGLQKGVYVGKSGEMANYNSNAVIDGMADLIVFVESEGVIFMEVKVPKKRNWKDGGLTGKQPEFRDMCKRCGVRYEVVYSLSDALGAVKKSA